MSRGVESHTAAPPWGAGTRASAALPSVVPRSKAGQSGERRRYVSDVASHDLRQAAASGHHDIVRVANVTARAVVPVFVGVFPFAIRGPDAADAAVQIAAFTLTAVLMVVWALADLSARTAGRRERLGHRRVPLPPARRPPAGAQPAHASRTGRPGGRLARQVRTAPRRAGRGGGAGGTRPYRPRDPRRAR